MQIGIYEQILNQLFEEKLATIDRNRFYIGERAVKRDEAAKILAMYLTGIFEHILADTIDYRENEDEIDVCSSNTSIAKGIELANSIIKKLVKEFWKKDILQKELV